MWVNRSELYNPDERKLLCVISFACDVDRLLPMTANRLFSAISLSTHTVAGCVCVFFCRTRFVIHYSPESSGSTLFIYGFHNYVLTAAEYRAILYIFVCSIAPRCCSGAVFVFFIISSFFLSLSILNSLLNSCWIFVQLTALVCFLQTQTYFDAYWELHTNALIVFGV